MEENKKPLSLIEKMKQRAQQQKNYGGEYIEEAAKVNARTCPNSGSRIKIGAGVPHLLFTN